MKILKRSIDKNGLGFIVVICEEEEDVWHIYNLIRPGDNVRCSTLRKVTTESQTGSKNSQRVHVTLTIIVETITYDPTVCCLHLKGQNIQENDHVRLGAYHTLDIELNRKFTLTKECWDSMDLDRLQQCTNIEHSADVAAVLMHEGLANICLLTSSMTIVKAKIDQSIARKRKGFTSQHDKSLDRFYNNVVQSFIKHVKVENLKCVLIASPGFLKDHFFERLMAEAEKLNLKEITQNKGKFLLVHSNSGFKHSLKEILSDPAVASRMADTKAQAEVKALDTFIDLMNNDPNRAVYGYQHVNMALEQMAIDTLMVSDVLFRSRNIEQRKRYVQLVDTAKYQGANVLLFSSLHATGEQLGQLTGVAAILRYPIEGIDEMLDDETDQLDLPEENWD